MVLVVVAVVGDALAACGAPAPDPRGRRGSAGATVPRVVASRTSRNLENSSVSAGNGGDFGGDFGDSVGRRGVGSIA